ncbi:E3 ubiquitin-protein ligase COP1-like [Mytilus californianus]|uniref:RFWD2 n=1 Tax=Mytilus coruscus TaxID=42192 RepID=A0A6J8CTJ3_MYTCO|nr:E3 ubiquitin-protein ligase COP1-like [Mytilus californianus]CAC5398687.1 RFWD2 [Mytilus coruscus]
MAGRTQQQADRTRRKRSRTLPPVYTGISGSFEDKDNDFVCPICFDIIEEAHMTKCGHTFCYKCIKQSLENSNRCPKCNYLIESSDQIFPNFTLNELIMKHRGKLEEKKIKVENNIHGGSTSWYDMITEDSLDLPNVNNLLEILQTKKQKLEADNQLSQHMILKDFLHNVRQKKQEQLDQLQKELSLIDEDLSKVEVMISETKRKFSSFSDHLVPNGFDVATDNGSQDGFNGSKNAGKPFFNTTHAARRKKVDQHYEDLEQCYFTIRQKKLFEFEDKSNGLDEFTESLSKFTRFSSFRPLATLSYASDMYNGSSNIVSSIEFDRDCDYFAIAGVTRKIKIYEYDTVIKDAVDIHYPVHEMVCNSKISCVTWSSYHKNLLASSDYEGTITLWDAFTGQTSKIFQEHEKRCWSVDFNRMDPKLLASGSDDAKVKLWSTNTDHSIACLEAKANVCCVYFNPESRYHLAFGSADHCVHYYDLRNTKQAVMVFKGHRKAVSYCKFLNSQEIVSASTDSQLKLWEVSKPSCLRTFKGHTNEKNFVGLATDGDYIACGSENNSLFVYYKGLSKQLLTFKFETVKSVLEKNKKEEEVNEFVSAVSWRPGSNVMVAANSQGTVKVLEMV